MAASVDFADTQPAELNSIVTSGAQAAPKEPAPATSELERRIQETMQQSQYRQLGRIECRVDQGIATLHGRVTSFYLKQLAQEQASRVDDIRRVVNLVEVIYA